MLPRFNIIVIIIVVVISTTELNITTSFIITITSNHCHY